MRVLGISGSLRPGSYNTRLLRAAALELPPGAQLVPFEQLADIPPYSEQHDGGSPPRAADALRSAIAGADAILIATPEYNASLPGQLKNALDWASRPFPANALRSKPVTVIGASTGIFGAVWAQAETRRILSAIGACVLDDEVPVGEAHVDAFAPDGSLSDPRLRALLADAVATLVQTAHAFEPVASACARPMALVPGAGAAIDRAA